MIKLISITRLKVLGFKGYSGSIGGPCPKIEQKSIGESIGDKKKAKVGKPWLWRAWRPLIKTISICEYLSWMRSKARSFFLEAANHLI